MKPIKSRVITNDEVEIYRSSKYQITTITPLVKNPKMNVYLFDQDQITEFLKGYGEYAEFIIPVEQVGATA
jgi:hypothetical protein